MPKTQTRPALVAGTAFRTPFEAGCVVTTPPDDYGHFLALDSDGVECGFSTDMVVCSWFALCLRPADRVLPHPAFPGGVPACARCAELADR